ncbi:MAG: helix-turn-helix transcriptional regulator [Lachnospiraceae bacterium]|nr:helix-turn-helix transcriptional regulator [Lachnospiraceae bacterium]
MDKDFKLQLGENIYRVRKRLGLTRSEFAERCDISEGYLAAVESGVKSMRAETLLKISRGAGVSADFLLTGKDVDDDRMLMELTNQLAKEERKQALNLIVTYINSLHDLKIKAENRD